MSGEVRDKFFNTVGWVTSTGEVNDKFFDTVGWVENTPIILAGGAALLLLLHKTR